MSGMRLASEEVGAAAAHAHYSAGEFAGQSAALQQRVEAFLVAVAAA